MLAALSEAPAASDDKPSTGQTSDEPAVVDEGPEETDDSGGKRQGASISGRCRQESDCNIKDLTNPVWIEASEGAKAAGEDFGMDVEVVAPIESNNNDEQIQLAQQVIAQQKTFLSCALPTQQVLFGY